MVVFAHFQRAWCLVLVLAPLCLRAQSGYDIDLTKPPKFESKTLASEKSTTTKWTNFKSFVQSTVTHYNYYFNANQKLLGVLAKARLEHQDDLTKLLSFYDYSLDETARDKKELDSVIYKTTAGIVLHDLRNHWIDNLYLLMGEAYYYQQKFDSCDRILEFLNYQFYVKEKGDYHIPIGTEDEAQQGQLSIVTPEKHTIPHDAFNRPPSRNDGLVFQVRSDIDQGKFGLAYGLISLLKKDPIFPERLRPALAEQQAYWYYRQEVWDSTAFYLQKALPGAYNLQVKARWEYLLAQLYTKVDSPAKAEAWYTTCIAHNTDPKLEIYARLYRALLARGNGKEGIEQTIQTLERLAKKDRFAPFRDILYLSAARLVLQQGDTTRTLGFLREAVKPSPGIRGEAKNQALLLMAALSRAKEDYRTVAMAYDSLQLSDPALSSRLKELREDKTTFDEVLKCLLRIDREDSLQRIAALPQKEREAYVTNLLKALRRAQGLKEEESAGGVFGNASDTARAADLFNSSGAEGVDWYFNNPNSLAKGEQDFQAKWGSRPNVDNWRRQSAIALAGTNAARPTSEEAGAAAAKEKVQVLSFANLMSNLPLTQKALKASNDTIARNMLILGNIFKNEVEDDPEAIRYLDSLHRRYPAFEEQMALFGLYYCWRRLGNQTKADYYLSLLENGYPDGIYTRLAQGKSASEKVDTVQVAATGQYQEVYDQFAAGNYDEALKEKRHADSLYGKKYWTPQLMYIEAVYYAHEHQDTAAIRILNQIILQSPNGPMAMKARTLKDVLTRRTEIENYLAKLKIQPAKPDSFDFDTGAVSQAANHRYMDSNATYMHLTLVNPSYKILIRPDMSREDLPGQRPKAKPSGSGISGLHSEYFTFDPSAPHYVILVMNQVASVYSREAKNAFSRYNQDAHSQEDIPLDTLILQIPGVDFVRFGPFQTIVDALTYETDLQKNAPTQIIPFIPAAKYRFMVISPDNLDVLRKKHNIDEYAKFIDSYTANLH